MIKTCDNCGEKKDYFGCCDKFFEDKCFNAEGTHPLSGRCWKPKPTPKTEPYECSLMGCRCPLTIT